MRNHLLIFITGSALSLAACNRGIDENTDSSVDPGGLPPVETTAANTTYQPAFAGQTRIAGVRSTTSFGATVLTEALKSPWGITSLPDGRLLVTEKAGTMRIITSAGKLGAPITGIPAVNATGQGGLLGVRVDPAFTTNRTLYWVFSEARSDGNLTAVAKGTLSADETRIDGATVIYRALPAYQGTLHYGGRIVIDPSGNLLVSTGERSDLATRPQAQVNSSALGKIVRITTGGAPVTGNPYATVSGALPELYSIGHRNPQGLALHPVTGDLWESEHGPRGGDEINLISPGANYGWPTITYGIEYSGQRIGDAIQQREGLQQPVYYWDPVVSPSGMTFYSGTRVPEWTNNLFVTSLSAMHIVRLVLENSKVVGEERLLADQGQRFRDITQGTDGALYAITDQGRLYRIDRN